MKDNTYQSTLEIVKTPRINQLIDEKRFGEALTLIDDLLENDMSCDNLYLKAQILEGLSKFDKSVECYNKALAFNQSDKIKINKANALYKYAKITFFPEGDYEKASALIDEALKVMPESEDVSEFYFLKAEILEALDDLIESGKCYLIAHGEFEKLKELESQIEYLNNTTDTIINITGGYFYDFTPSHGLVVDLIKEEDNEHDCDAIAVYLNNEKIGYVANSDYTLMDGAKSASQIKNKMSDSSKAEILFVFLHEYVVAKLLQL